MRTGPNVPLIAWAPDADPTTPGVMAEVSNLLPTARGYAPDFLGETAADFSTAVPAIPLGSDVLKFSDGTQALVIGTGTALYHLYIGAIADVTRAAGPYTPTSDGLPWYFAAFNQAALAGNFYNTLQYSNSVTTNTDFADVPGAPAPGTFCVQRNFVICARFGSGGTPGFAYGDGWWCSAQENIFGWTPDIATQCARGRLTATPGDILRLMPFGDTVIAFKNRSMYRGTYSGPTANTWSWPVISTTVGIAGPDAVTQADGILYWIGTDGAYRYAGGAVQRIASTPWNWLLDRVGGQNGLRLAMAQWDPVRRLVRWYVTINSAFGVEFGIAYHPDTDRWGLFYVPAWRPTEVAFAQTGTVTGDTVISARPAAGYFERGSALLKVYSGNPGASSFTTGDIGDDDANVTIQRARARFVRTPATSSVTHYHRATLDASLTTGETANRDDGKYDISYGARWHRLKFAQTGMYEVLGFSVASSGTGRR